MQKARPDPFLFNHFEVKMPTYFSGLHKSGYIFTSALILMVCLFPEKSFMEKILMLIITSFAGYMLLFGWGIRTPLLMLFAFFFGIPQHIVQRGNNRQVCFFKKYKENQLL